MITYRANTDLRGHTVVEAHLPCINGLSAWVMVADLGKPYPEDEMFGGLDREAIGALIVAALNAPARGVMVVGALATKPPCTVCGTAYEKHGSYPTCASHPYTPDGNCQHVPGALCVGAECRNGCVRGRGVAGVPGTPNDQQNGGA